MTPAELQAIGVVLHGPTWRFRLAEVLGIDRSRVSRWAAGRRAIPEVAAKRIRELAGEAIDQIATKLERQRAA